MDVLWMNVVQGGHACTAQQQSIYRRLNSSDVYKQLLNPGGKEKLGALEVEEVERWRLTNVRAVECWEKREQKKTACVGSRRNGGENVSEHVLQDRLSGSR